MARSTLVERFIDEYVLIHEPYIAARRAGVPDGSLRATVRKWLRDDDISRRIADRLNNMPLNEMVTPQAIYAGFLRIANSKFSTATEKNTALRELGKLTKLYPDSKGTPIDEDKKPPGVLMVPGDASLDNWERAATASQKKLKADVTK